MGGNVYKYWLRKPESKRVEIKSFTMLNVSSLRCSFKRILKGETSTGRNLCFFSVGPNLFIPGVLYLFKCKRQQKQSKSDGDKGRNDGRKKFKKR